MSVYGVNNARTTLLVLLCAAVAGVHGAIAIRAKASWTSLDAYGQVQGLTHVEDGVNGGSQPGPGPQAYFAVDGLVKQFVYDGLGRLIETRTPVVASGSGGGGGGGSGSGIGGITPTGAAAWNNGVNVPLRVERHHYDGIRRVQTLVEGRAAPAFDAGITAAARTRTEISDNAGRASPASPSP